MMSETIELRCPYLNWDCVAMAFDIPSNKRTKKEFLKEVAKNIVPDPIIYRDKRPLKTTEVENNGIYGRTELVEDFRVYYSTR